MDKVDMYVSLALSINAVCAHYGLLCTVRVYRRAVAALLSWSSQLTLLLLIITCAIMPLSIIDTKPSKVYIVSPVEGF